MNVSMSECVCVLVSSLRESIAISCNCILFIDHWPVPCISHFQNTGILGGRKVKQILTELMHLDEVTAASPVGIQSRSSQSRRFRAPIPAYEAKEARAARQAE